jgi:hypothetical protein
VKNANPICGSKGEGLLTPQQCVFTLTARPGAFDVNRKTGSFAKASIRLLPDGSAGQSERDAAVLPVPNNCVVAQKPLPLESLNIVKKTIFINNMLVFIQV